MTLSTIAFNVIQGKISKKRKKSCGWQKSTNLIITS